MKTSTLPVQRPSFLRAILTGAILPAAMISGVSTARAVTLLPPDLLLNSDNAAPVFLEGLREGFVSGSDNETAVNPLNGPDNGQGTGISLGLRMGQSTAVNANAWAGDRTWIYTGEIFTGPNGIISVAANNDDADFVKINGVTVLNDNAWDTAIGTTVGGLTPNTWVPFEYRVGNGGGGAGPSGQNINGASGWTTGIGVVMSYEDEFSSNVATNYIGGLNDLGQPTEVLNGTPTLFRFQNGFGFSDDLVVQNSAAITITGGNATVAELSLRFDNLAPATLTINDGVGSVHKTLSIVGTTQWATFTSGGSDVIIDGTSDFRPAGIQKDNGQPVRVIKNGTGALILDNFNANSSLDSTTFVTGTGPVSVISAGGVSPVPGAKLEIGAATGVLRIGSPTGVTASSFSNAITATASGTLEHSASSIDTLTGTVTATANQNLTINVTGGRLYTAQGVVASQSGARITKSGSGMLRSKGAVTARNLTVNDGRYEITGSLTLLNSPVLNGGTLAILNTSGSNTVPNPLVVSGAGALEARGGGLGVTSNVLELATGGTFRLAGNNGLQGYFYGGDDGGAQGAFGAPFSTTNTYTNYTTYFNGRGVAIGAGGLEAVSLTTAGDVEVLNFNPGGADAAMYSMYGQTRTNNIVSRMVGKIFIEQTGTYTFQTTSDDGSMLYIDGAAVVNNNASQGMTPRNGSISLAAGLHDIDIGYYEGGGGNGLIVDWAGPGITGTQNLPNSVLFPSLAPEVFANPVNVTGNSTINTVAATGQITGNVTLTGGVTLTLTGRNLTMSNVVLPAAGIYKFNTANETTLSQIVDNGNDVDIEKLGSGVLIIDNIGAPHLQNPGSSISIKAGSLGVLLGAPTSPTGQALINFDPGTGVVLSSKSGDQSYTIPAFVGSANVEARKLGTGVAGTPEAPIVITLNGSMNVASGNTFTLGTADNYVEKISGTASGSGTVGISGGTVTATTANALQGLKVKFNKPGTTATLNLQTNAPSVGALDNDAGAKGNVVVGDGLAGAAVLTVDSALNGKYYGTLGGASTSTVSVIKNGTGRQSFLGASTATSYTVTNGTLELSNAALADATIPINLSGGALQFANPGLLLKVYDTDPNVAVGGVAGAYTGILNTLPGVFQRYSALGPAGLTTLTTANNNQLISYNPGGGNEAPFGIHGYTDADTVEAIFTGQIDVPTAGVWTFDPRSDDGTNVFVDGQLVSMNNFGQGIGHVPRPGSINLTEGRHSLVITFNEGTGGAGMFVNVTAPGGTPQLLSNSLLLSPDFTAENPVTVTGSANINPNGGTASLGPITQTSSAVLGASGGGLLTFPQTTVTGGSTLSYNPAAGTTIKPGQLNGATILNASGAGNVFMDFNGTHFTGGVVNVTGGNLIVGTTPQGTNPINNATVNLSGGGALKLTTVDTGDNITYSNNITFGAGGGAIQAGRFTYGKAGTFTMTVESALNISNSAPLSLAAFDGYNLAVTAPIVSNGPISSTAGSVQLVGPATGTNLTVAGGQLDTSGALNFAGGGTVAAGGTLRLNGNTYTGGTVAVSGTLDYNGTSAGVPATLNGGRIKVSAGVVDYAGATITGSPVNLNPGTANRLSARAYSVVNPAGGFGTDQGLANTLAATPAFSRDLDQPLNFGPAAQADAVYNTFFGGNTGDAFTAAFVGKFTAPANGPFTFGRAINDDSASIWIDLNQNGVFEQNGSAGDERIQNAGCCAGGTADDTFNTAVNLIGGQSYRMVFIVEDTGGGSSFAAKWGPGNIPGPGALPNFVDPANQPGIWSYDSPTGGAKLEIAGGGQLKIGSVTNATEVLLTGDSAQLTLNSGAPTTTTIENIRVTGGSESFPALLEVTTGNTANAAHVTVSPGTYITKTGAGTLNAASLSVGNGATFDVSDGLVVYTSPGQASLAVGGGSSGTVAIGGTGVFDLEGVLNGSITLKTGGGTLKGAGTVGTVLANPSGIISPGTTAVGTINTVGDLLMLDGSILQISVGTTAATDKLNVTGQVFLSNTPGPTLTLGFASNFNAATNDIFPLIINDLDDPVTGNFAGLSEGAMVALGIHSFQITYLANLDGGTVGNDVALTYVVPEPGAVAMLLGGFGMLLGAQRLRRRK